MSVNISKTMERAPQTAGSSELSKMPKPLFDLRQDIDRLFDGFFVAPFGRRLFDSETMRRLAAVDDLRMDLREDEKSYELTAELPGVDEKDIDITVSDGRLTIRAEKKEQQDRTEGGWRLSERRYGTVSRTLALPDDVDEAKIAADFDKGVLHMSLPRRPEAKPQTKKIEVKAKH